VITRDNYEIWFLDFAEGKLNPSQQEMLFAFLEENPDLKKELDTFENISFEKPLAVSNNSADLKKKQSWLLEKYSIEELVFNFCENNLSNEELREWNDLAEAMPELLKKVEAERKLVLKPLATENFDQKLTLKKNLALYSVDTSNYKEHFILYAETKELALHTAISLFLKTNPDLKAEFELTQKLILKADTSIVFENKNELKKKEKIVAFYQTSSFAWRSVAVAACLILAAIFFYPSDNSTTKTMAEVKDTSKAIKMSVEEEINPINNIKEEVSNQNNSNVALNKKKKQENQKLEIKNQKIVPNLIEDKKENNFVEVPKIVKKNDTIIPKVPSNIERPLENLANNQSNQKSEIKNQKSGDGLNPLSAVASLINKKYYEEQTPKSETASTFYAMKNVVRSVSGGNADIEKKEDSDYKETGFRIGEFKFSRKKNKNKVDVD
jgi:hypothetical protein